MQKLPRAADHLCSVRTPRVFHFDPGSSTQVQEYLPGSMDLKSYALKHFSPATPESEKPGIAGVARGIGKWLRGFHQWAGDPEQAALRSTVGSNKEMQGVKLTYNYERLLWHLDKFPFLRDSEGVFREIIAKAAAELEDEGQLQIIHGDFWPGKSVMRRPSPWLQRALLSRSIVSCSRTRRSSQTSRSLFS